MNKKNKNTLISVSMLLLAMLACVSSSATPVATEAPTLPPTLIPVVVIPSSTSVPTASNTSIPHVDIPGELPVEHSSFAGDQDSFITSAEKRAPGGDRFTFGRFERPFNADTMDVYHAHLDIQENYVYRDAKWIYIVIILKGGDADRKLGGKYGVEIDSDLDGRGDWLITNLQPASKEWSTDNVEVWFDTNNDVGGSVSVTADELGKGNGYETKIFDRGQGDDADLAWARLSSQQAFTVQLAVKTSLLGGSQTFMAGVWAGGENLDPSLFDLNDHFTQDQAGSSLVEFEFYYPIKAIFELDNACRVAIGFQPTGNEPGLCTLESGACPPSQVVCVDTIYGPNCFCGQP